MGYCPADCADNEVILNQSGDCEPKIRTRSIAKIGFFPCDVDLPEPFTCAALEALKDANRLAFSSELANIELQDPVYEEIKIADCKPPMRIAISRTIVFQDRVGITGSTGSPAIPVQFFENEFWVDKRKKQARLRYMIVYCDGSVQVAKDENGNLLEASLNVFRKNENIGTGQTAQSIEYIQGELVFKGDPIDIANKPEIDGSNEIFNINECSL